MILEAKRRFNSIFVVIGLRVETQHTPHRRISSVFGFPSIPSTDYPVDSVSSELIAKLRSKTTRFEIVIGLKGTETKRLVFQLVVDECSN